MSKLSCGVFIYPKKKLAHSNSPKDWYFALHKDEDSNRFFLLISESNNYLDDTLEELPKEIKQILLVEGIEIFNIMESVFEFESNKTKEELVEVFKKLGFNHLPSFEF